MRATLDPLGAPDAEALSALLAAIGAAFPLSRAHLLSLPRGVRSLWASLTGERGVRRMDYMNDPASRAAYLRYFLPWNVYRYLRVMPLLAESGLLPLRERGSPRAGAEPPRAGAGLPRIIDLGSGPMAFPIALYLGRPDLRELPLEFDCVDRSARALSEGEDLLRALATTLTGKDLAWRPKRIKASFMDARGAYDLVLACFAANELFEGERIHADERARRVARKLESLVAPGGSFLILEPGTPPAAGLLYALRADLGAAGWAPRSPCTHAGACPLQPRRGSPWCHFAFDAEGVPKALEKLSRDAGLPKERASLSWLAMGRKDAAAAAPAPDPDALLCRVISDPFSLPGGEGCYACCAEGRILLRVAKGAAPPSGARVRAGRKAIGVDQKSGAGVHIPLESSDNRR